MNEDLIFVIFVVVMVLLFFILLIKRLYRKPSPFDLEFANIPEFQNGAPLPGHMPTLSLAVHLRQTVDGTPIPQTPPPPFDSAVGLPKVNFKTLDESCNVSECGMECPPPSYEEYLSIHEKFAWDNETDPEKSQAHRIENAQENMERRENAQENSQTIENAHDNSQVNENYQDGAQK